MGRKILFLESSDIGADYSAEAARSLGYEPVFFCNLADYHADPKVRITRHRHYDLDTTSVEAVLAGIQKHGIDDIFAVMTFSDSRLKIAAETALQLDVRGIDPAVIHLKDKASVAEMIPEHSPRSLLFNRHQIPFEALSRLFDFSSRVFFKPAAGSGALGVFTLEDAHQLTSLANRLAALRVPSYMGNQQWVAQPYISGSLISAEGFVCGGRIQILGFTDRRKIGATESAATFPIDEKLSAVVRAKSIQAISDLMLRSEFKNGYFHIEFLVEGDRAVLIDANMGRVGGAAIAEQLAIAYGITPVQVFEHILSVTLFGELAQNRAPYKQLIESASAILYGVDHEDTIESVLVPDGTRCFHTQILGRGAQVSAMGENDWSWVGILSGKSRDTAAAIERIRIRTHSGEYPPCF